MTHFEVETDQPVETEVQGVQEVQKEQPPESDNSTDEKESGGQYKEGEMLRFVRVRFPGNAKSFPFMIGKRNFQYGQKVIAPSDRGMALGYINSFPYEVPFSKKLLPLKYINKVANESDIEEDKANIDKQKEAEVICLELIEKFKLDMNLTHVEFTQFGKKAVFYFTAPNRVDFRSLVKELVSRLKTRIELRQISNRDRAASIGGIGSCGRQLCCSSFLQRYGTATIKMAKNQNMMLAGNKINGVCSQLKCCIQYEDEVYTYKRKRLPREGSFIQLENGDRGKVLKLEVLSETFTFLTDTGIKKRFSNTYYNPKTAQLPKDYQFPKTFDHITDESNTLLTKEKIEHTPRKTLLESFRENATLRDADQEVATPEEKSAEQPTKPKEQKVDGKRQPRNKKRRYNKNRKPHHAKRDHSKGKKQGDKK
jgi:cell fate regulator YaaT (PSP1 superfamily)